MITPERFWNGLKSRGFRFFSGVPCSLLKELLDYVPQDPELYYVPAVREDVALGIASGAWLAGRPSGVLMQNSGLGNIVNPLTSFSLVYEIPILLVISWRGHAGKDAPEHLIMGAKMTEFLDMLRIGYAVIDSDNLEESLERASAAISEQVKPFALIIRKGIIG